MKNILIVDLSTLKKTMAKCNEILRYDNSEFRLMSSPIRLFRYDNSEFRLMSVPMNSTVSL